MTKAIVTGTAQGDKATKDNLHMLKIHLKSKCHSQVWTLPFSDSKFLGNQVDFTFRDFLQSFCWTLFTSTEHKDIKAEMRAFIVFSSQVPIFLIVAG